MHNKLQTRCPVKWVRLGNFITSVKVSFYFQCIKPQSITLQNFHILTFFGFSAQIISRIHLILPNAYKLMALRQNPSKHKSLHRKKPLAKSLLRKIPPSKMPPHLNASQQNTSRHNATQQNTYNLEKAYVQI